MVVQSLRCNGAVRWIWRAGILAVLGTTGALQTVRAEDTSLATTYTHYTRVAAGWTIASAVAPPVFVMGYQLFAGSSDPPRRTWTTVGAVALASGAATMVIAPPFAAAWSSRARRSVIQETGVVPSKLARGLAWGFWGAELTAFAAWVLCPCSEPDSCLCYDLNMYFVTAALLCALGSATSSAAQLAANRHSRRSSLAPVPVAWGGQEGWYFGLIAEF